MQNSISRAEAPSEDIKIRCLHEVVELYPSLSDLELAEMYLLQIRCEDVSELEDLPTIAQRIASEKTRLGQIHRLGHDKTSMDAMDALKQAAFRAGGVRQFLAQVREVNDVAKLVGGVDRLQVFLEALESCLSDPEYSAEL